MANKAEDEATNILQNGILVETSKGVVCLSLNDAITNLNLNLSVEDLQHITTQLVLQQADAFPAKENSIVSLQTLHANSAADSEGYTSECSDTSGVLNSIVQPTVLTLTTLPNDSESGIKVSKIVSFVPVTSSLTNCSVSQSTVKHTNVSDSDTSVATSISNNVISAPKEILTDTSENKTAISENPMQTKLPIKRRGGWPKGRKRKPELLHLPPKAPATGYNLYLNEQRKLFKGTNLVFHEITKIIGNKWSSLSLEEKRPYLDRAEEEKKRYREEFRAYKQSGAYQMYLTKKRRKRVQYNVLSESDMDATDEIDEEDNEELYCRTCDQWFHNLHNKKEHLLGRQHQQVVAGDIERELGSDYDTDYNKGNISSVSFSTSLDESSLDALPGLISSDSGCSKSTSNTITDLMMNIKLAVKRREIEYNNLQVNLQEVRSKHVALYQQWCSLKDWEKKLKNHLLLLKDKEKEMEAKVVNLWQVPSWFVTTNLRPDVSAEKN